MMYGVFYIDKDSAPDEKYKWSSSTTSFEEAVASLKAAFPIPEKFTLQALEPATAHILREVVAD